MSPRGPPGDDNAILLGGALYFAPTIVAIVREHRSWLGVGLVNLLAGWTGVGWPVALAWAAFGWRRWRAMVFRVRVLSPERRQGDSSAGLF